MKYAELLVFRNNTLIESVRSCLRTVGAAYVAGLAVGGREIVVHLFWNL